jgi:hypothetical protein
MSDSRQTISFLISCQNTLGGKDEKKTGLAIIESVKTVLFSEQLKQDCRTKSTYFTRKRLLTFPVLIGFLLNMLTKSLQLEIEQFLKVLKGGTQPVSITAQAVGKARKKFSEEAFLRLDERLVEEFYTDNTYTTWHGYRLIGIDGSTVQLPMSEEIVKAFGGVSNQYGLVMAMAKISVAFDVENEISVHACISKYCSEERELALRHLEAIRAFDARSEGHRGHQNDLFLFDMGYPALYFMVLLILWGKEFVIRTSDAFLKEVQDAIQAEGDDVEIRIPIQTPERPLPKKLTAWMPDVDPDMVLSLRVVKLTLADGTRETLLTTLRHRSEFPSHEFPGLYAKRWGSEGHYDVLKNILELENFTGKSARSVRQDFSATVLTNNIRALIHWELQEEIDEENQRGTRRYQYQLNRNLSIGRLKDQIVTLVLNQGDLTAFYADLKAQMKRNMLPIRPGRHFPRTRKNHQKYTMTKKRAL